MMILAYIAVAASAVAVRVHRLIHHRPSKQLKREQRAEKQLGES